MKPWIWIVGISVGLYALHRLAIWAEDRGWIYYRNDSQPGSMSNAMLEIQSIVDPSARHTIEMRQNAQARMNISGDPPVPGARIRSHVALRDVAATDVPIFYEHQRDPIAAEMAAFPMRDHITLDAHWMKILADPTVITQTILVDGAVVGNLVSFVVEGAREVGYWIDRDMWGQGVATVALQLFVEQIPQRPLFARVAQHNVGSRLVAERCGFVFVADEPYSNGAEQIPGVTLRLD